MADTEIKGQIVETARGQVRPRDAFGDKFVLEKNIFSNIFDKDIKRVYLYKKAERLAKAIHLITPAFADSLSLRNRLDAIAVSLVDAAILPPASARLALSRELLALSSVLSIARTGGILSAMNAELIAKEAHLLLQEVAAYEEPRVFLDDAPTLAEVAREAGREASPPRASVPASPRARRSVVKDNSLKGHSVAPVSDRRDAILDIVRGKEGGASIKDVSTMVRGVSEKTIQRELSALVASGKVERRGERRWSTYHIV